MNTAKNTAQHTLQCLTQPTVPGSNQLPCSASNCPAVLSKNLFDLVRKLEREGHINNQAALALQTGVDYLMNEIKESPHVIKAFNSGFNLP